jgi:hypothetical protein
LIERTVGIADQIDTAIECADGVQRPVSEPEMIAEELAPLEMVGFRETQLGTNATAATLQLQPNLAEPVAGRRLPFAEGGVSRLSWLK